MMKEMINKGAERVTVSEMETKLEWVLKVEMSLYLEFVQIQSLRCLIKLFIN